MLKDELARYLRQSGVEFKRNARKAELQALYDELNANNGF